MSAINTEGSTIAVVVGGTPIPLPQKPYLSTFIASGDNEVFTVPEAGTYYISYKINLTAALLLSASVLLNGAAINDLTVSPLAAVSALEATAIMSLSAGDTLSLVLFGLLGAAILQGGNGASLTVIKLA